ncbi:Imm1 family immunity protein [Kribbella sp. NPDC051718]|uniref:Imm1 family immunity protein n=1 Tax=Kribbella sp. NPDC051718 TaxID=3155168 RepID=UPI003447C516
MTATAEAYFRHEHDEQPVRISTEADVDRLIDDLLGEEYENSVATVYVDGRLNSAGVPDHELLIGIDNAGGILGGLRYMSASGTYYGAGQPADHDELVYYYAGQDREFPVDSQLPVDEIRAAVKEFLSGGGEPPPSVEWKPWPEDLA